MSSYNPIVYGAAMFVSSVLFACLMVALFSRVRQEVRAGSEGQKARLPWADAVVAYVGMPTLAIGGLMLPLMGLMLQTDQLSKLVIALTGFGVVLAGFYPIAVMWHHELSVAGRRTAAEPGGATSGEVFMVCVSVLVAIGWAVSILR